MGIEPHTFERAEAVLRLHQRVPNYAQEPKRWLREAIHCSSGMGAPILRSMAQREPCGVPIVRIMRVQVADCRW